MINSDLAICENNEKATNRYKIKKKQNLTKFWRIEFPPALQYSIKKRL